MKLIKKVPGGLEVNRDIIGLTLGYVGIILMFFWMSYNHKVMLGNIAGMGIPSS